jgi:hypothetical protein
LKYYNQRIPTILSDDNYFFQMDREWMYVGNRVTALLHIEILEPNSKLASKLSRLYTCNVKKGGTYLSFRKEFTIEMDSHTY